MKINIQIVLKGLPVTSWTGLPACCCFLVFLVLPSRTASGLSIYSWDTPWKDNLRRRGDIQTHEFLSVGQKLLKGLHVEKLHFLGQWLFTYKEPGLLKQIKAPLKPHCCVRQHWPLKIWSAIAVFPKDLHVCVSVCLCLCWFLPTSELFGRVSQVSSIRLDHTPVINKPANSTTWESVTSPGFLHYCRSL